MAFEHFGFLAPFYDHLIRFGEADALFRRLALPVSGRLLDAGGGTGRVSELFKGRVGQTVVADVSAGMLRQAQGKGLTVVKTPAEALPFPDGAFERVLMMDALHHVADQVHVVRELWRMVMPGGRLLIVEPDIRLWAVKGIALFEKIALFRSHFLSPPDIVELFDGSGRRSRIEVEASTAWVIIDKEV